MALNVLAYNIKRMIALVGIRLLMQASQADRRGAACREGSGTTYRIDYRGQFPHRLGPETTAPASPAIVPSVHPRSTQRFALLSTAALRLVPAISRQVSRSQWAMTTFCSNSE